MSRKVTANPGSEVEVFVGDGMYWQRCHHCVNTFGAVVDCRQADMASTCAEKPQKPTYSSGLVATISSKRQYLGLRLLLLLALFLPAPTRARYVVPSSMYCYLTCIYLLLVTLARVVHGAQESLTEGKSWPKKLAVMNFF